MDEAQPSLASSASTLQTAVSKTDHTAVDTMIKEAARSGDITTLQEGLRLGAKPQNYVIQALSVPSGSPDAYICLLDAGLDVNYRFPGYMGNALIAASKHGKVEIIRMLLSRGADPNLEGVGFGGPEQLGALACAAECFEKEKGVEAMRLLLEARAKVDGSGALQVAAKWGHLERVKILVEEMKVDVNDANPRIGSAAILLAKEQSRVEVIEYLRKHGAMD